MAAIRHVWFDLDGTLAVRNSDYATRHADLRHHTYAEVTGQPYTDALAEEYEALYRRHGSNSAVFKSLGLPGDFWQQQSSLVGLNSFYHPRIDIIRTLQQLREQVPISLFTNGGRDEVARILQTIHVEPSWFTHVITGDDVTERKPALAGFNEIIRRSELPPAQILYVGDRVATDLLPAKSVGLRTCLVFSSSDESDYAIDNFADIIGFVAAADDRAL